MAKTLYIYNPVNNTVSKDGVTAPYLGGVGFDAPTVQSGGGGVFGAISNAVTNVLQPVEKTISSNLAQLDKDLSLSQNAPVIAAIALSVAAPGVGSAIGQQMLTAGIIPQSFAAYATAIGTGVANAALQVAQGKSPEEALKVGVIGAAGGAVGNYLVGDPGTVKNFVTSTSTNLLAGKNPEDAVIAGIASSGAGLAGRTVAVETGSAVAGQVAAGTTAGLLSGKTGEQALLQGVGNIKIDSLIPDSGVTVANEAQVTAGQQDLMNQLAPYEAVTTPAQPLAQPPAQPVIDLTTVTAPPVQPPVTIEQPPVVQPPVFVEPAVVSQEELRGTVSPFETTAPVDTTTSGFDIPTDIPDTFGFDIPTATPTTPITGNTGENMATDFTDYEGAGMSAGLATDSIDYEGAGMSADLSEYLADPEGAAMYADIQKELNLDPEGAGMSADLSKAIDDYSKETGVGVKDVLKFFKDNPNLAKTATSLISAGVGLFGTKLATDTAREAARVAAEAQKFKPVGVTTRFGTTDYKYDADNNLVSAGYTLTPDLKAIQDKLMSGATLSLDEAKKVADLYDPLKKASTSLFDLGTSYLAKTPEQVASDYMAKQQDLLAPSRERQLSQLQNTLFQQGRGGLSVGATSARPSGARGLGATTPEMEAYYNALAQQDASLAAGAQRAGQESVLFGKGLLGAGGEFLGKYTAGQVGAYDPFKSLLASAGTVESMGAGALDVGTALGGRRTTAATNAANTLMPSASVNPYSSLFTSLADDPSFKAALQNFITGSKP